MKMCAKSYWLCKSYLLKDENEITIGTTQASWDKIEVQVYKIQSKSFRMNKTQFFFKFQNGKFVNQSYSINSAIL